VINFSLLIYSGENFITFVKIKRIIVEHIDLICFIKTLNLLFIDMLCIIIHSVMIFLFLPPGPSLLALP